MARVNRPPLATGLDYEAVGLRVGLELHQRLLNDDYRRRDTQRKVKIDTVYDHRVAKVNVDDNPDLSTRYKVLAIPTVILFKDGEERERLVGSQTRNSLESLLDRHLSC